MGKTYTKIDDAIREFTQSQQMFFVATAPTGAAGHVNLSPKGLDTFRILGPTTVAYVDHVGSGAETIAHLRENGRIVIMVCAFEGPPKIVRFYGRGKAIEPRDLEFANLHRLFPSWSGIRAIVLIDIDRVGESCGFGVPLYQFKGQRPHLGDWVERKGCDGLQAYQQEKNRRSIDGLPTLRWLDEGEERP